MASNDESGGGNGGIAGASANAGTTKLISRPCHSAPSFARLTSKPSIFTGQVSPDLLTSLRSRTWLELSGSLSVSPFTS